MRNLSNGLKKYTCHSKQTLSLIKILTKTYEIQKGTSQGCPLSPLFILMQEVLNRDIEENEKIKGIKIKTRSL